MVGISCREGGNGKTRKYLLEGVSFDNFFYNFTREREKISCTEFAKKRPCSPLGKRGAIDGHLGFGSGQRSSTIRVIVPRHTPCTCVPPFHLYQFIGGSWGCSLCPGACPDGGFAQGKPPPGSHGPATREPSGIRSWRVRHPFALYSQR